MNGKRAKALRAKVRGLEQKDLVEATKFGDGLFHKGKESTKRVKTSPASLGVSHTHETVTLEYPQGSQRRVYQDSKRA